MGASFPRFPACPIELTATQRRLILEEDLVVLTNVWGLLESTRKSKKPFSISLAVDDSVEYSFSVESLVSGTKVRGIKQISQSRLETVSGRIQFFMCKLIAEIPDIDGIREEMTQRVSEALELVEEIPPFVVSALRDKIFSDLVRVGKIAHEPVRKMMHEQKKSVRPWNQFGIAFTPTFLPRGVSHSEFLDLGILDALRTLGKVHGAPDANFRNHKQELIADLMSSQQSFALALFYGQLPSSVTVWIRKLVPGEVEEGFILDAFPTEGLTSPERMYGELMKTCAKWGVTAELLASQCVSILYEGHEFLDDVAYLVKQRVNREIKRVPFLSFCVGRQFPKLVKKHAASFKIDQVMKTLGKSSAYFAGSLVHKLDRLLRMAITDDDADDWIQQFVYDLGLVLGNMHLLSNACQVLAPILVDWAEILLPAAHMTHKMAGCVETSQDHILWLDTRRQYLETLRGDRVLLSLAREKLAVNGVGIENMSEIIAEIIEVMDLRFIVTDAHKEAFARYDF